MENNRFNLFGENYVSVVCSYLELSNKCNVAEVIKEYEVNYIAKRQFGKEIEDFINEKSLFIIEKIKYAYNKESFCRKIYEELTCISDQITNQEYEKALVNYLILTYVLSVK